MILRAHLVLSLVLPLLAAVTHAETPLLSHDQIKKLDTEEKEHLVRTIGYITPFEEVFRTLVLLDRKVRNYEEIYSANAVLWLQPHRWEEHEKKFREFQKITAGCYEVVGVIEQTLTKNTPGKEKWKLMVRDLHSWNRVADSWCM